MSNSVLETGVLDYINSYPFVGLSVGTNFFKLKKLSNDRTISPHPTPEKRRRYDPKTGKKVKKNIHKEIIYDPETGEVMND